MSLARTADLNLLPVLLRIYENGSVSAAATELGMSQSAVSAALGRLREQYGDPLFHRVGQRMQPTARMRALAGPIRDAVATVEATLRAPPAFDPRSTTHVFSVAMTDLGEMVFLPKIARRLRELAPHAAVRSVAAPAAQISRGLETGEIDLAVGYFPDLRDKAFQQKHLFFHHFVCLLRADHPMGARALTLAQFLQAEHAVVYGAGRTYEIFERYLKAKKLHRRVTVETPHFMSIPFVLASTDLIATVPHAVGAFVTRTNLGIRAVRPPVKSPRIDLKMHWHQNFQRDARSRWLRELVAGQFSDELDEWRLWADPAG